MKCFDCGKGAGEISFLLNKECQLCGWGKGKEFCPSCFKKHELALQKHEKTCNRTESDKTFINLGPDYNTLKPTQQDKTFINLGPDYNTLKPTQQEGRQKTQASWSNKKNISFVCIHCKALFAYDKSIESYLEARNRAKNQITNHLRSCSFKESSKSQFQEWWTGIRSSKTRIIKTCETCW
jgi:hypothetical protein